MASSDNLTSKHQKFEYKDADLLNDTLPEHVISRILSLLPTNEAIKTSILSKRWRFLWTTISNLDFSDYNEVDLGPCDVFGIYYDAGNRSGVNRKKFIRYVSSVLRRLDPTISIDKLSISLMVYPDVLQIKKWISSAVHRNVKDLTLSVDIETCEKIVDVPRKVFGCKSVEALTLCSSLHLKIPKRRFVCFPNLKFLTLEYIRISGIPAEENSPCFPKLKNLCLKMVKYDGKDDCVMKLIRNCPLLEDLSINRSVGFVSNVDMCIPQLSTVDLFCGWTGRVFDGLNVQIEAPIKSLTISNWNPATKIVVKNLDSLVKAELNFDSRLERFDFLGEQGDDELLQLFKTVDKVKCLTIFIYADNAIKVSKIKLPLFVNLTRLVVVLSCKDLRMLEGFLNSAINLEILVIQKWAPCHFGEDEWCIEEDEEDERCIEEDEEDERCIEEDEEDEWCIEEDEEDEWCIEEDERWTKLSHVPKCMISSLKRVDIVNAADCPGELDMIKSILESAKVLEKLTTKTSALCKRSNLDSRRLLISQLERASASCQFDILHSQ